MNSAWEASILTNGSVQYNTLRLNGTGIVTYDTAGILHTLAFTAGDSGSVLSRAGTWVQGSNFSQWLTNGSNIYYNGGKVGIGTSTPAYPLTVNGSALINGTLFANYAAIANTLTIGTFKIVDGPTDSIVSVSSALNLASDSVTASNSLSAGTSLQGGTKGASPITISSGQITSALGNISFANNNLTTTGKISSTRLSGYLTSDSIQVTQINPKDSIIAFGDPALVLNTHQFNGNFSCMCPELFTAPHNNGFAFCGNNASLCSVVFGIGTVSPDATLSIQGCQKSTAFSVLNSLNQDVYTIDNSGNTNIYGQLYVHGIDPAGHGVSSTFANGLSNVFVTAKLNAVADFNPITKADDNGIFWSDNDGGFNNSSGFVIAPHSQSAAGIRIDANGNVSINDDAEPGYTLTVNGKIITTDVMVKLRSDWPDYVFKKDYKLMSLDKLEAYLHTHTHLPGLPSAQQIKNNGGVDVSNMIAKQQQKLEEMSLYLIQLNKQIEALKAENEKLSKQVEKLSKKSIK